LAPSQHALFEGLSARMAHFVAPQRQTELLPQSRLLIRDPGKSPTAESKLKC
jgi:hypothetical protein